jgi:hypothetical protein
MKRDIHYPEVQDIAVAIVQEELTDPFWGVYLLNLKEELITNVLISSKGYGMHQGEDVKTSTLRHYFAEIQPKSFVQVEPIDSLLFKLSNEFWVSFYVGKEIYDKKYVFLPESIIQEHLIDIPLIGKRGVMIR